MSSAPQEEEKKRSFKIGQYCYLDHISDYDSELKLRLVGSQRYCRIEECLSDDEYIIIDLSKTLFKPTIRLKIIHDTNSTKNIPQTVDGARLKSITGRSIQNLEAIATKAALTVQ